MTFIYSTRFIITGGASSPVYTVPTGKTAVIRSITAFNADSSSARVFNVVILPQGVHVVWGQLPALATVSPYQTPVWDVRHPVLAGEQIQVNTATSVEVIVSGYLFTT
jgi:hypothetical protein